MSTAIEMLKAKVQREYREAEAVWHKMTTEELIEDCEEVFLTKELAELLPAQASEEDAEYLLRFVHPLKVVVDSCNPYGGLTGLVSEDFFSHLLWEIRDTGDAEVDYQLEPGFGPTD